MEMSITRALRELTLLDDRINNKIRESSFVAYCKNERQNVTPNKTKAEFILEAKENIQSLKDLIERRTLIKSKVCQSNQNTIIKFDGKDMKVIDAINYKDVIQYKKQLLSVLRGQYNAVLNNIESHNNLVDQQANNLTSKALEKETKGNSQIQADKEFIEAFKKSHGVEIIDPLKIEKLIKDLVEEIEKFESEMDYILSESNARTVIEIED